MTDKNEWGIANGDGKSLSEDKMRVQESAYKVLNEPAFQLILKFINETQNTEILKHFTCDAGHVFAQFEFSKGMVFGLSIFMKALESLKQKGDLSDVR